MHINMNNAQPNNVTNANQLVHTLERISADTIPELSAPCSDCDVLNVKP